MIISTEIRPFNLYVVSQATDSPGYLPSTPPASSHRVHSASPAGGAANDAVSGADWAGKRWVEASSHPPSFLLILRSAPAAAGRLSTHLLASFGWRLEVLFWATVPHQGQQGGPLYFSQVVLYP